MFKPRLRGVRHFMDRDGNVLAVVPLLERRRRPGWWLTLLFTWDALWQRGKG